MKLWARLLLCIGCCALIASAAFACKVPVFRYALERWSVDRYRIVVLVDDSMTESASDVIANLRTQVESKLNADLEVINVSQLTENELWQLDGFSGTLDAPRMQVFFPERNGQSKKCWEGELTEEAVSLWTDSPLRREIAADITEGISAVWILVEGTDAAENNQVADQIRAALTKAAATIQIPEGVISREDASTYLADHSDASMDDVLRSDLPLKVDFRLRRLSRDDPNELALQTVIASMSGSSDSPRLVPVFGRGRMLDVIPSSADNDKTVLSVCNYMIGECSCTVKSLNPGVDLLLSVDWAGKLGNSVVMVDAVDNPEAPTLVPIPQGTVATILENAGPTTGQGWSVPTFGLVFVGLSLVGFALIIGIRLKQIRA